METLNNIIFTSNTIMKISGQTTEKYIGYDMTNDSFMEVDKKDISPVPESIKALLGSEECRLKIALELTDNLFSTASILNVCDRTLYRRINQYLTPLGLKANTSLKIKKNHEKKS